MATIAEVRVQPQSEERFFAVLAAIMAVTLFAGFALQLAMGRSTFAVPWPYHLHAFVFFSWIALFVTQTRLMANGNMALHRRLGWLIVLVAPAMVVMAIALTIVSIRRTGGPFFFDANEFLFGNCTGMAFFAGLIFAAVRMRRRTDWHRRLMLSAIATIMGPGLGRILPSPLLIPWAWEITNTAGLVFVIAGMLRDRKHLGHIHPAWFVGIAATIGWITVGEVLAYTDWGIALTKQIMAGYPGAARPMQAYMP